MEGVGKCGRGMEKCVGVWERCWGCGEVWGEMWKSAWSECGGCGEVGKSVLGYRKVWRSVEKCGGSPHTLLHLHYTSPHTLHTYPTPLPTPPHSPNTSTPHSPPTSPHFPKPITPFLHLPSLPPTPLSHTHLTSHLPLISPNTFPHSHLTLPHNPLASSNISPYSSYFIIYSIPKFFTILIYCKISLTMK